MQISLENTIDALDKIVKVSRERYAKQKDIVEEKIARWSGVEIEGDEASPSKEKNISILKEEKNTFVDNKSMPPQDSKVYRDPLKKEVHSKNKKGAVINCYECGTPTEINFKPDGIRPVYCKKCFQKMRSTISSSKPEIPSVPIPEISLQEALLKQPISFSEGRRHDKPDDLSTGTVINKIIAPQSYSKIHTEDISHSEHVPNEKNGIKILKPGQIVKL